MKRVLLIDVDDVQRASRVLLLHKAGYEVVTADRFDLVEDHIREATFDLVLMETEDIREAVTEYANRLRATNLRLTAPDSLAIPHRTVLAEGHASRSASRREADRPNGEDSGHAPRK